MSALARHYFGQMPVRVEVRTSASPEFCRFQSRMLRISTNKTEFRSCSLDHKSLQ